MQCSLIAIVVVIRSGQDEGGSESTCLPLKAPRASFELQLPAASPSIPSLVYYTMPYSAAQFTKTVELMYVPPIPRPVRPQRCPPRPPWSCPESR